MCTYTRTHTHLSARRNMGFSKQKVTGWGPGGYVASFWVVSPVISALFSSHALRHPLCRWLERNLLKYLWLTSWRSSLPNSQTNICQLVFTPKAWQGKKRSVTYPSPPTALPCPALWEFVIPRWGNKLGGTYCVPATVPSLFWVHRLM